MKYIRLMLGRNGKPCILVEVEHDYDQHDFQFSAVNGGWSGRLVNGELNDGENVLKFDILSDDQEQLRGRYEVVFGNWAKPKREPKPTKPKEVDEEDIVYRLRKRAEIRRQIPTRKSVQEGQPDRIADLLEEAANEIEKWRPKPEKKECCVCGTTENLHYDGHWYGWRCDSADCVVF